MAVEGNPEAMDAMLALIDAGLLERRNCSSCRFSQTDGTSDGWFCHRYPPVQRPDAIWFWPRVTDAGWCGEWAAPDPQPRDAVTGVIPVMRRLHDEANWESAKENDNGQR